MRLFRHKEEKKKSLWERIVDVALKDVTTLVRGDTEGSLERLEELLHERFGIEHTTLQAMAAPLIELEDRRRGG